MHPRGQDENDPRALLPVSAEVLARWQSGQTAAMEDSRFVWRLSLLRFAAPKKGPLRLCEIDCWPHSNKQYGTAQLQRAKGRRRIDSHVVLSAAVPASTAYLTCWMELDVREGGAIRRIRARAIPRSFEEVLITMVPDSHT